MKIAANSAKGLVLGIVESRASDGKIYPAVGPFQVDVADPGNTINVVPGTADQKTATIFRPNGSGALGTVTVKVTDTSNNLVGSTSFDVVAPAPPPPPVDLPDTLIVSFASEP
jgi:hypothetical protein